MDIAVKSSSLPSSWGGGIRAGLKAHFVYFRLVFNPGASANKAYPKHILFVITTTRNKDFESASSRLKARLETPKPRVGGPAQTFLAEHISK